MFFILMNNKMRYKKLQCDNLTEEYAVFKKVLLVASLLASSVVASEPAFAGKADDTLRVALPREMDTLDIYANAAREGVIMSRMIWDGLFYRDPESGEYIPNLATSFRWKDDKTMLLQIRDGITFHNGEVFDADDVVYTLNWIANPENGVKQQRNVNWIDKAEKLSDNEVQIKLKKPFPAALEYLSGSIVIYPNEYFAKVGPEEMGKAPVGTGPYKVTEVVPGKQVTFEKYEGYHASSPKGQPSIGKVVVRMIPEKNTQMAEMLAGNLDWIWQIPADQAEKLGKMDNITVDNASTMRIGYLGFDASARHSENPMNNVLVRKAVAHAINRQGIVDALLKGASEVVHAACFPSQFGCTGDVVQYDYNPDKARELLAEAGYKDGFTTPFYAYRNRDYAEAMINDLAAVGIKTDLVYLKYAAVRDKIHAGEVPFSFMTWGSYSINDVSAITSTFFDHGKDDYARDPDVKKWLDIADNSTDPKVRIENYTKALQKIAEEVYWLPLWSYNAYYVYSSDLEFTPTSDEIPRFFRAKWK